MWNNKNVFVCVWLPCSGKWTQSRILAESLEAGRIESWARLDMILIGEIHPELSDLAQRVRNTPNTINQTESELIERAKLGWEYSEDSDVLILDWFWRRLNTYELLCDIFGKEFLTFMHFHITAKTMYKRAQTRWIDPQTRQSYTLSWPSEENQLWFVQRESDQPEILWYRLRWFKNRTLPVLEAHRESWGRVIEVNAGHPTIEAVTIDMMAKLRKVFPEMFSV